MLKTKLRSAGFLESEEYLKDKKGITLIALVVTIIVLIILAAVTINLVIGNNGIITRAQDAGQSYNKAGFKEQVELDVLDVQAELIQKKETITLEKVTDLLKEEPYKYTVDKGELPDKIKVSNDKGEATIDKDYIVTVEGLVQGGNGGKTEQTPPIPDKFSPSTVVGETNIDNGFVIIGPDGSEFVWVPVKKAYAENETELKSLIEAGTYPMAVKTDSTNYRGVLYNFALDTGTDKVKITAKIYSPTEYREPDILSTSDGTSYDTVVGKITTTVMQEEYNKMVKSIEDNGGFYIARYETSRKDASPTEAGTATTIQSKKEVYPMNSTTWYNMYTYQKNYVTDNNIANATSGMIWGSQWDQVMIWMKEVKNRTAGYEDKYYILDSTGMGNYSGTTGEDSWTSTTAPAPTGCVEVKNIYDMAGNVYDWTMEALIHLYVRGYRRRLLWQCRE